MSLHDILAADRRLVILCFLEEDAHYRINEDVLKSGLDYRGHAMSRDQVRGEIIWLEQNGLVEITPLKTSSRELWLVTASEKGVDVARGLPYPGVARPAPK